MIRAFYLGVFSLFIVITYIVWYKPTSCFLFDSSVLCSFFFSSHAHFWTIFLWYYVNHWWLTSYILCFILLVVDLGFKTQLHYNIPWTDRIFLLYTINPSNRILWFPCCHYLCYFTHFISICYNLHSVLWIVFLEILKKWKKISYSPRSFLFLVFLIPLYRFRFSSGIIFLLPEEITFTFLVFQLWW